MVGGDRLGEERLPRAVVETEVQAIIVVASPREVASAECDGDHAPSLSSSDATGERNRGGSRRLRGRRIFTTHFPNAAAGRRGTAWTPPALRVAVPEPAARPAASSPAWPPRLVWRYPPPAGA